MYLDYSSIISFLQSEGINPILYGSLGVSIYLGRFKDFDDIDLLIEDDWLNKRWPSLVQIMQNNGFNLIDKKEHEFMNKEGVRVAFASQKILQRDDICDSLKDLIELERDGITIKTLTPKDFIKAYEFSSKDGYRREKREKNDLQIIKDLKEYVTNH